MIDRRPFIGTLTGGLGAGPLAAEAQQAAKTARIGYLAGNLAATPHLYEAFRQGLRDLGHGEGRNVVIEYRDGDGTLDRLSALAAEVLALKGARPGDLPVEQTTKFELVISLKSTKALGLTMPQSVRGRAREVIQ